MRRPKSRRLTMGPDTFMVKFAGPFSHQGETLWFAKTVIASDQDDRIIAGDAFLGSLQSQQVDEHQVAGLNGIGGTPDAAYQNLKERLAKLKSHEF